MDVEVRSNGRLELRIGRPKGGVQQIALKEMLTAICAGRKIVIEAAPEEDPEDWIILALEGGS